MKSRVRGQIMHVIFTPKGQRLRNQNFGTNLIQYIFNPSDTQTWDSIVTEIKECIRTWLTDVQIKDVELGEVDEGRGLAVRITYSVTEEDGSSGTYEIISRL
jgi:phage baseplate assembly protein W